MIRTTATADTSGIDSLLDLLEAQDTMVAAIGQRVYDRHAPDALAELRKEPGAVKKPIQWTSDKQRKFVMAMLRKDNPDGTEYPRTHALSQGWVVKSSTQGNVFSITFENPAPEAKFVYGSMAKNVNAAARFQQRFHIATGWQAASPIATRWTEVMIADFRNEWKREVQVRRRAYTKGTRRAA